MSFNSLPDDVIKIVLNYLEKPHKKKLSPPGHFAVVGPAWSPWRCEDKTLVLCSFINWRLYYLTYSKGNWKFVSYYSKSYF